MDEVKGERAATEDAAVDQEAAEAGSPVPGA